MILVDTSVWIDFFRGRPSALEVRRLIEANGIVCHEDVLGELALGTLPNRARTLDYLRTLPSTSRVPAAVVHDLIGRRRLSGTGIGWVDANLLASAERDGRRLWTHDRRLAGVAAALDLLVY
ncbi:MAG TPA: PIN domain-containing protein [Polyangia bacterium]|nr:PIN domain-containing protein [Polyangia bacterium]